MICEKCNAELKEGAKFCTTCGTKVSAPTAQINMEKSGDVCPKCSAQLKPNAKFCTSCGFNLVKDQPTQQVQEGKPAEQTTAQGEAKPKGDVDSVKNFIFWNIEKGQIARKINESEFIQYDSAKGVIVNEGTTAFIKADGKIISRLSGGNYNFIDPRELEKIINSRTGGVVGASTFSKIGKSFWNFLFGTKVIDVISDPAKDPKKQKSIEQLVSCMRQNDPLMSITLMLDRDFELLFGATHQSLDDYSNFMPMKIRTKVLDIDFGVRATFRIDNSELFVRNYLADNKMVSASMLSDRLTPIVQAAIQKVMSDVEVDSYNLSLEVSAALKDSIVVALGDSGYGISLVDIISISLQDKDIERLRDISRELYLSEKELDFLSRSNDLKNRMNIELDEQEIRDAQREGDKERRLLEINKDNLLSEAEYNKFIESLNFDAQVRAIRNNADLLEEQFEAAKRQVSSQHNLDMMAGRNSSELLDVEIERNKKVDAYNRDKELNELEFQNKKADSAIDRMRKMKEMKREEEQDAHRRALEVEQNKQEHERTLLRDKNEKELSELEHFASMSSDQVMSVGAMRNMDAEGAKAYAEAMGKKFESENKDKLIENLERMNSERNADRDRDNDRLERMMMQMMGAQQNQVSQQNIENERLKNDYEAKLERQERRVDATSEMALEYATRNNSFAAPTQNKNTFNCPHCGVPQEIGARFCDDCGCRID